MQRNDDTPPPKSAQDREVPDDWYVYNYKYSFMDKPKSCEIYHAKAYNDAAKGTVFYSLGWKTHPVEKRDAIEDLNSSGYDVLVMPLVHSHDKVGTMPENIARMAATLFNKESIIHSLKKENAPLFVITHSTSAIVYELGLMAAKYKSPYDLPKVDLTVHTNPYIHARGASKIANKYLSKIYRWHANNHRNEHAGVPFWDRTFYVLQGMADQLLYDDPGGRPTHGQVLEISAFGDVILSKYNFAEHDDPPIVAYISTNDNFASPEVAQLYFENKVNLSKIHFAKAGHNVMLEPSLRANIIDMFDEAHKNYHLHRRLEASTFSM